MMTLQLTISVGDKIKLESKWIGDMPPTDEEFQKNCKQIAEMLECYLKGFNAN